MEDSNHQECVAPDAIVSADSKGFITDWNDEAKKVFGWRKEEIIGRSIAHTIVPKQYRDAHLAGLARHITTGRSKVMNQLIQITALHANGSEFPVELMVSAAVGDGTARFSAQFRRPPETGSTGK
jgi:PAS domain S-box-containing protein